MENLRPTYAEINLSNLISNLSFISSKIKPKTEIMAVVKADAYGHGADLTAKKLFDCGVNIFGVSSIEEGIALRHSGINANILILGSQYPFENFREVIKHNLIPTISSVEAAMELSKYANGLNIKIGYHYKVDTGMGRIGVSAANAYNVYKKISVFENINIQGVYTHLAKAETDKMFTRRQLKSLKNTAHKIRSESEGVKIHAANSAAALMYPESQLDIARIGLALYGLKPFSQAKAFEGLKPVLSLKSKVVFIKKVPKNTPISYCSTFRTKKPSWIATIPIGYADGYSRLLSNNGRVIIKGKFCPVVGRVTMDMIMADVTNAGRVYVGDNVVLIGSENNLAVTAEEIAEKTNTISYEVVCRISSRVPRKYVE